MANVRPLIAVVDDEEPLCAAIERLVRSIGMEAITFLSGEDLLQALATSSTLVPDCVVLDLQMPGLNGLEVQARLRASGVDSPVLFITAHEWPGARERAMAGGATAFLCKPFEGDLLIRTLRSALSERGGHDPSA